MVDEITEQQSVVESIYAKDDPQNFMYEESIRGSEYQKAAIGSNHSSADRTPMDPEDS